MSVIWHTTECTIRYGFEITVSSKGSIMLVELFVAVRCTPLFIIVTWLGGYLFNCV